jgi:hypothetical protein
LLFLFHHLCYLLFRFLHTVSPPLIYVNRFCFCVFVFLCFCVFVFGVLVFWCFGVLVFWCFCVFVFLCFCVFVFLCFCVFVFCFVLFYFISILIFIIPGYFKWHTSGNDFDCVIGLISHKDRIFFDMHSYPRR